MRKRSGGEPPARELERRAMRSSRSLASTSWTSISGSSSANASIRVRYALISAGSPKTRKRTEPEEASSDPPQATTSAHRRAMSSPEPNLVRDAMALH
jgi:hypothetical protein